MPKYSESYEAMPHGVGGLRISVYSEKVFGSLPHHHEEYCLFYMKKGCLLFGIGNEEFYVHDGDIVFVEPNTPYYMLINENTSQPQEFHYYSVVFDISMLGGEDDLCRRFLKSIRINSRLTLEESSLATLPEMRKWDIEKPEGYELFLKNALLGILTDIAKTRQYVKLSSIKRTGAERTSDAVNQIIEYLEKHYTEKPTIDGISKSVGYSTSHIHRIFKQTTGMSIIRYLNRYRVERACLELLYTDKKITQIAADNGFEHGKNFSKVFSDCMGMSPMKYRKIASGTLSSPPDNLKQ